MISDAVSSITDSFKEIMDKATKIAEKGKNEINTIADKSKDLAGTSKKTDDAWQS